MKAQGDLKKSMNLENILNKFKRKMRFDNEDEGGEEPREKIGRSTEGREELRVKEEEPQGVPGGHGEGHSQSGGAGQVDGQPGSLPGAREPGHSQVAGDEKAIVRPPGWFGASGQAHSSSGGPSQAHSSSGGAGQVDSQPRGLPGAPGPSHGQPQAHSSSASTGQAHSQPGCPPGAQDFPRGRELKVEPGHSHVVGVENTIVRPPGWFGVPGQGHRPPGGPSQGHGQLQAHGPSQGPPGAPGQGRSQLQLGVHPGQIAIVGPPGYFGHPGQGYRGPSQAHGLPGAPGQGHSQPGAHGQGHGHPGPSGQAPGHPHGPPGAHSHVITNENTIGHHDPNICACRGHHPAGQGHHPPHGQEYAQPRTQPMSILQTLLEQKCVPLEQPRKRERRGKGQRTPQMTAEMFAENMAKLRSDPNAPLSRAFYFPYEKRRIVPVETSTEVKACILRLNITQKLFGERILNLKSGQVSDVLHTTKRWEEMYRGAELFIKMDNFMQLNDHLRLELFHMSFDDAQRSLGFWNVTKREKKNKITAVREIFPPYVTDYLAAKFTVNPSPEQPEIDEIALYLKMEKTSVKTWFANRRNRWKHLQRSAGVTEAPQTSAGVTGMPGTSSGSTAGVPTPPDSTTDDKTTENPSKPLETHEFTQNSLETPIKVEDIPTSSEQNEPEKSVLGEQNKQNPDDFWREKCLEQIRKFAVFPESQFSRIAADLNVETEYVENWFRKELDGNSKN